jgi:hypothetical protein
MRLSVLIAIAGPLLAAATAPQPLPPGIYTNEEDVYFDTEAKRTAAPWIGIRIGDNGEVQTVDKFGQPSKTKTDFTVKPSATADRLALTLKGGLVTELRRARGFTCWGAAPKATKKPDGSDDWFGASKLTLHDQGGRVSFGGGATGAPETVLRMRNVIWPSGPNRPSLVLYVHTPAEPDKAVSYSWADKDAKTIGINLRWMQASCTLDSQP